MKRAIVALCLAVNADFFNKSVWITYINDTDINMIVDSETIPGREELP